MESWKLWWFHARALLGPPSSCMIFGCGRDFDDRSHGAVHYAEYSTCVHITTDEIIFVWIVINRYGKLETAVVPCAGPAGPAIVLHDFWLWSGL